MVIENKKVIRKVLFAVLNWSKTRAVKSAGQTAQGNAKRIGISRRDNKRMRRKSRQTLFSRVRTVTSLHIKGVLKQHRTLMIYRQHEPKKQK